MPWLAHSTARCLVRPEALEERTFSEDLCRSLESISSPGNRIDDVHLHSPIHAEVLYGLRRHEVKEDKVLVVPDPGGPIWGHRRRADLLICSFWLVAALAIIGEEQRARDLMERLLRAASPLGLFAEELDVDTGRHLGNFPQASSHLALIGPRPGSSSLSG
jgi:hypothetical protein